MDVGIIEALVLRHCIPPLVAGILLGVAQQYLFLRNSPRSTRQWAVMTGMGALAGTGLLFSLFVILSLLDPDREFGLATLVAVFCVYFVAFGANGFVISLFQFRLLGGKESWQYLVGAWISSIIAILVSYYGVETIYYYWLRPGWLCPVVESADYFLWVQPMKNIVSIFIYGVGTSIALMIMKKIGMKSDKHIPGTLSGSAN